MVELKDTIEEIECMAPVKRWIKGIRYNTQRLYLSALAEFCIVNELDPQKILDTIRKEEEERIPVWERSVDKWFENYDEHCINEKRSIRTRNVRKTAVSGFISYNELPTYSKKGNRRRLNDFNEPNERKALTKKDVRKMLETSKTWKVKAIILFQASSGISGADLVEMKVKDFKKGVIEVYDKKARKNRKICMIKRKRVKTGEKFTTFLSEEAVEAIDKYLELERVDPKPNDALFSNGKNSGEPMKSITLHSAYRNLNKYLGWKTEEKGQFRRITPHMMRKFFNTQMVNAGMPEEIREHFMAHKLKDKVRDAYFLANPKELQKVYVEYMGFITIRKIKPPVTMSEFTELKTDSENLMEENKRLQKELDKIKNTLGNYEFDLEKDNKELENENKELSMTVSHLAGLSEVQELQISELKDMVKTIRQELSELKSEA